MSNAVRIHLALILVSCLFGVNYVVNKQLLLFVPAAAWAFMRVASTTVLLTAFAWRRFSRSPPSLKQWAHIAMLGVFGVVINQIAFLEGLSRTSATHAAVINTTIPLLVLLFSIVLRQEPFHPRRLAGAVIAMAGVLIVLEVEKQHFGSSTFLGDLLNLCNATSFSLYLVLSRRLNRVVDPIVVTAGMFLTASGALAVYGGAAAAAVNWFSLPGSAYAVMFYVVFGATLATYYLNNWALSKTDSTMVAIYIYIQPVMAGILSRLVFGEKLTLRMLVASLLVFAGVAIGSIIPIKRRPLREKGKAHVE